MKAFRRLHISLQPWDQGVISGYVIPSMWNRSTISQSWSLGKRFSHRTLRTHHAGVFPIDWKLLDREGHL
jgi:hypothetical protein